MELVGPRTRLWGRKLFFGDRNNAAEQPESEPQPKSPAHKVGGASSSLILGGGRNKKTPPTSPQNNTSQLAPVVPAPTLATSPVPETDVGRLLREMNSQESPARPGSGGQSRPKSEPQSDMLASEQSSGYPSQKEAARILSLSEEEGKAPEYASGKPPEGCQKCPFCDHASELSPQKREFAALFAEMINAAAIAVPQDPTIFFLDWLFQHAAGSIPANVMSPFFTWRHKFRPDGSPRVSQRASQASRGSTIRGSTHTHGGARTSGRSGHDSDPVPASPTSSTCNKSPKSSSRNSAGFAECLEEEEGGASTGGGGRGSSSSATSSGPKGCLKKSPSSVTKEEEDKAEVKASRASKRASRKSHRKSEAGPGSPRASQNDTKRKSSAKQAALVPEKPEKPERRRVSFGGEHHKVEKEAVVKMEVQLETTTEVEEEEEDEEADDDDSEEGSSGEDDDEDHGPDPDQVMHERAQTDQRQSIFARRTSHWQGIPSGMQSTDLIVDMIKGLPLFSGLEPAQLEKAAGAFEIKFFEPEQELVGWGQKGGDLNVIYTGEASFSVPQQAYKLDQKGDIFGLQSLTKRHIPSQYRITAGEIPLITFCLTQAKYDKLSDILDLKKVQQKRNSKILGNKAQRPGNTKDGEPAEVTVRGAAVDREMTDMDKKMIADGIREDAHLMEVLQPNKEQIAMFVEEMKWLEVPMGQCIYQEGEMCDSLFVVHDGLLEIKEKGRHMGKLRMGQSFGELGLLYGTPSNQEIRATRDSVVWELNHEAFSAAQKKKPATRSKAYADMLKQVPAMVKIVEDKVMTLADALDEVSFVYKEEVLPAGVKVNKFFLVWEGSLQIGTADDGRCLKSGDHFGLEEMGHGRFQQHRIWVKSETAVLLIVDRVSLEMLVDMNVEKLLLMHNEEKADRVRKSIMPSKKRSSMDTFLANQQIAIDHIPMDRLVRIGILGAGSFGNVSMEEDPETGKSYALKAMSKGYVCEMGIQAQTIREKKIHAMLDSPFIVRLFNTYKCDQFLYFLLQPAMGGDLFEVYQDHEEWWGSDTHALFFSSGLAIGLEHMHSKKIIYRDLKLENVLMDANGYALVADMGLAKIVFGKTYTVCGTADYMAPETLRRTGHNRAVDWWALGIVIFILMSGRSPFDADDAAQIYRNIVKGLKKEHFPDTFKKLLRDIIGNLCKKKPEERLTMGPRSLAHFQEAGWCATFDWEAMHARTLPAPWVPSRKSNEEIAKAGEKVEAPPVVNYEDDGTEWDAEF